MIQDESLSIQLSIPFSGSPPYQSDTTLSCTGYGIVDQVSKDTGVVQHNHILVTGKLDVEEVDCLCGQAGNSESIIQAFDHQISSVEWHTISI